MIPPAVEKSPILILSNSSSPRPIASATSMMQVTLNAAVRATATRVARSSPSVPARNAREYDRKAVKFSKSGQVDAKAREAREALDGPEAQELREAEEIGKQHGR